mgnify:CR=1 FL=1
MAGDEDEDATVVLDTLLAFNDTVGWVPVVVVD